MLLFTKKIEEKGGVLSELFNSVPLFDAVSNSGHVIMGQWMTHNINNYINNYFIHKSDHLAINLINYLMPTIYSGSLPHPQLVAFLID